MDNIQNRAERAGELFLMGYNCCQSTVGAFADLFPEMSFDSLMEMVSSLGGGIGRLREVCGTVTGMGLVIGKVKGYHTPNDDVVKQAHYERIQQLAYKFKDIHNSIICGELLGGDVDTSPVPSARTPEYYASRPCYQFIKDMAEIIDECLKTTK